VLTAEGPIGFGGARPLNRHSTALCENGMDYVNMT
jgi:hypothetical protein